MGGGIAVRAIRITGLSGENQRFEPKEKYSNKILQIQEGILFKMKIAFKKLIISPAIGTKLAGYSFNDVSIDKLDDLYLMALCLDDGQKKVMILEYDLLGVDQKYIADIRQKVADCMQEDKSQVIISCTHTHTGPNTRILDKHPEILEVEYLKNLTENTVKLASEILKLEFIDTDVYFYSVNCDQNINRRYIGPENKCTFLPYRRDFEKISDGICDKELGIIFFYNKETDLPVYVIGNYAAHSLAGHAPGVGGLRISADYPGAFRRYVTKETGAECMFISGAAGDMVPKGHELGTAAIDSVGVSLAQNAIIGMISGYRNKDQFKLNNEMLQSAIQTVTTTVRPHKLNDFKDKTSNLDGNKIELEIQLVSIGEICLIGVPGELVAELGLEMKWHSPFRKTFVLYCSTGYYGYLCHGNALLSGGYEGRSQCFDSRIGLGLVNAAIDGAYKLYDLTFTKAEEKLNNIQSSLVALKTI